MQSSLNEYHALNSKWKLIFLHWCEYSLWLLLHGTIIFLLPKCTKQIFSSWCYYEKEVDKKASYLYSFRDWIAFSNCCTLLKLNLYWLKHFKERSSVCHFKDITDSIKIMHTLRYIIYKIEYNTLTIFLNKI